MSKKLTTSTNDVLDSLALDDSIVEIDASKTSTLTIDDNIKVQKYAIYKNTATKNFTLLFTTPVIFFTSMPDLISVAHTGFGVQPSSSYIELTFAGGQGFSVAYCFGVVFIQEIDRDI